MSLEFQTRLLVSVLIAVAMAVVFVLLVAGGLLLARQVPALWRRLRRRPPPFAEDTLREAGHGYRRRLTRLNERLLLAWATFAVLAAGSAAVWQLLPSPLPSVFRPWAVALIAAAVTAVLAGAGYLLFLWLRERHVVVHAYRASRAVGHALQRLALEGHRVFHSVPCENYVLDHVVVGPKGVFVVNVVPYRKRRRDKGPGEVRIAERQIDFDGRRFIPPVLDATRKARCLANRLSQVVRHPVAVKSAIIAPGWEPKGNDANEHLLLTTRTVTLLTRWTTPDAHLMREDAVLIHDFLTRSSLDTSV
ncbi:MAG TPA: nuclease-related domain-containing protein [Gammaproteobacteria bacterium]|nr:nuclease-related domain-containing protein [Gammaproteobacteria bacterium]